MEAVLEEARKGSPRRITTKMRLEDAENLTSVAYLT